MVFNKTFTENCPAYLKWKAEQALKIAKELELQQLTAGKKFVELDNKTIALR